MEIHSVIQQRRRALGLTQEQVAEYLGVTAPAVNKWEKGSTCPDIALLPPLARLLKIDLNTLFGFYAELTQQEIALFCKEITQIVQTQGFAAGFSAAQEKIHAHPNSDTLLHTLALQLQGLLPTAGLSEDESMAYLKQIDAWYDKLSESDELAIRNGACYMLASRAIGEGQYEKAQEYLDRMPNRADTPDKRLLQASVYLRKNQAEEAAKKLEGMLIAAVNEVQMVLFKLMEADVALGDDAAVSCAAKKITQLAETFDLHPYNTIIGPFLAAVARKDVRQSVELLRKLLNSMSCEWNVRESPLYRHAGLKEQGGFLEKMIGPLIQGLKSPEYEFLQTDEEFLALIKAYDPG